MHTEGEEYIRKLGEATGLAAKLDEGGSCHFSVEGGVNVIVHANEEAGCMELTSVVAQELPEGISYSDMMDLLDIALGPLFGMPGLGREPESGALVFYAVLPFRTTTQAEFAEAAIKFMEYAQNLSARLSQANAPHDVNPLSL